VSTGENELNENHDWENTTPVSSTPHNRRNLIIAGAVVVVIVIAIISFSLGGSKSKSSTTTAATSASQQVGLSTTGIKTAVDALGRGGKVYWLGPVQGDQYTLVSKANGQVTVTYVPAGQDPKSNGNWRAVGTYPVAGAFSVTKTAGANPGSKLVTNSDGSIVVYSDSRPTNVYVAFPGVNYQIEIYDPTPGAALQAATGGLVTSIG